MANKVIGTASNILNAIKTWATGKFVAQVSGKGLSTNDYTTAEKNKLSGIEAGAQVNVIESVKVDGTALTPSNKAVNIDLSSYAKKTDLTSVYRVKGSTTWATLIAKTDAEVGDVWNITDKGGANYVCTTAKTAGEANWDKLGETVDLSGYATKTDLATKADKNGNATESFAVNHLNASGNILSETMLIASSGATIAQLTPTALKFSEDVGGTFVGTLDKNNYTGKAATAGTADKVPWSGVTGKPSSFKPSSHTHVIADITDVEFMTETEMLELLNS